MTKDMNRVLSSIEMGMRNHEWVPVSLIEKIAKMKRSLVAHNLSMLLKYKLVAHITKPYDGYKLHYMGYDFLALGVFKKLGVITKVETKIGVGKESDIYLCRNTEGKIVILKLTRLGRTSFKTVKRNREYTKDHNNYNWLYLSRLSALREFKHMQALFENGFPVPVPIVHNRHAIVMSFINGFNLFPKKTRP